MMTNKKIHRFSFDGEAKDIETIIHKHHEWTRQFIIGLRDQGYVPVLDIDPALNMWYNEPTETFRFDITVQAVYLGRRKAWEVEGLSNGEEIPRRTTLPTHGR